MGIDSDSILVFGVILIGLFGAVLYYFLRFFFRAGRYDDDTSLPEKSESLTSSDHLDKKINDALIDKSKVDSKVSDRILDKQENLSENLKFNQSQEIVDDTKSEFKPKALSQALENTRSNFFGRIKNLFQFKSSFDDEQREGLEEILYTSDLGPMTVQKLMDSIDDHSKVIKELGLEGLRSELKKEMINILSQSNSDEINLNLFNFKNLNSKNEHQCHVWLVVGVNGVGKTTTIGKLAHGAAKEGKKVLIAAGDTFRAAADAQLRKWSERAQVEIFSPEGVKDPSAVAFDACQTAKAKNMDLVIIDTAGRLHTQANLMEELKKMKRVIQKVFPESPDETLLVLDANSGQNALVQAKNFNEAISISGVVLTKMDGTAKGGVALGIAYELQLPIKLIGVGESMDDLRPFNTNEFVQSIL